jgi:hypothetical protein
MSVYSYGGNLILILCGPNVILLCVLLKLDLLILSKGIERIEHWSRT